MALATRLVVTYIQLLLTFFGSDPNRSTNSAHSEQRPESSQVAMAGLANKCNVNLAHAAQWRLPEMKDFAYYRIPNFPYYALKNGGVEVTVVHRIKTPEWMFCLHEHKSLAPALSTPVVEITAQTPIISVGVEGKKELGKRRRK